MYISLWELFSGASRLKINVIVLCNFLLKIDGFEEKDS